MAQKIGMDVERIFGAPKLDMQTAEEFQLSIGHDLMRELKK